MVTKWIGVVLIVAIGVVGTILAFRKSQTKAQVNAVLAAFVALAVCVCAFFVVSIALSQRWFAPVCAVATLVAPIATYFIVGRTKPVGFEAPAGVSMKPSPENAAQVGAVALVTAKAEESTRLVTDHETRPRAEREAHKAAEAKPLAKAPADGDAKAPANAEAKALADAEAKARALAEARAQAETDAQDARRSEVQDVRIDAQDARHAEAQEARAQARAARAAERDRIADERKKATEEMQRRAERARMQAEQEARMKAKEDARKKAEAEALAQAEAAARADAEARAKARAERIARAEEERAARAEAERRAAEEARAKAASAPAATVFDAQSYFNRATELRDRGMFAAAVRLYQKCAKETDDQTTYKHARMEEIACYVKIGDIVRARALAQDVLATAPDLSPVESIKLNAVLKAV